MRILIYLAAGMLATGAGLVSLLVVAVMIFAPNLGECIEVNNSEVYYTENVTEAEAQKLVEFVESLTAETPQEITFQLDKRGDDYLYRMCAQPIAYETDDLDASWIATETLLEQDVFPGANVIVELCDDSMTTRKTIDESQPEN
ncbi:MAG: hypothetical protein AAF456_00690 [Planctomycetota bacterium]